MKNNYAYIAVLSNEKYLPGIEVLRYSLEQVGSKYPFYVLMPKNADPALIERIKELKISTILEDCFSDDVLNMENSVSYWKDTLYKLKIFNLTRFSKIICLDADMIVLRNIDHLFDKPHMSAVLDYDQKSLNSGLVVITPDENVYRDLVECIFPVHRQKSAMGDQDVIRYYYSDWSSRKELHLPASYGVIVGCAGYLIRDKVIKSEREIYVYHYTGRTKPWMPGIKIQFKMVMKVLDRSGSRADFKIWLKYKSVMKDIAIN